MTEQYAAAKAKLEAEKWAHGTPEDAIRVMCLEWLEWDEKNDGRQGVAALLTAEGKDTKGAYKAMEHYARKQTKGGHCVKLEPVEAMTAVMEYYGVKKDSARTALEGGLMYYLLTAEARKYKPYSTAEGDAAVDTAKATPGSEIPTAKPAGSKFSLDVSGLEDLL